MKQEQTIMAGVLTEADVMRAVFSRLGRKGGGKNSPAQQAWRKKAGPQLTVVRMAKREKERRLE